MFRFTYKDTNWIIRFSGSIELEASSKEMIIQSIVKLEEYLACYKHGDSFAIFHDELGMMIIFVENLPSSILTVTNIIPKENWYHQSICMKSPV